MILVYYKITGAHVSVCASVSEKHSEHLGMSRTSEGRRIPRTVPEGACTY